MGDLTHRQQRFVDTYLGGPEGVHGNATQAAIQAGYSRRTAAEQGHALLRKPQVQACLAQVLTQAGLSRDRVLDRTGVLAFAVLAEVATYVPGLGLQLEPDALAHPALAEVEELPTELAADGTPRTRLKLKLRDPTPHLESLRKLFGIDKPDPGGLAERVTLIIERAREAPPA